MHYITQPQLQLPTSNLNFKSDNHNHAEASSRPTMPPLFQPRATPLKTLHHCCHHFQQLRQFRTTCRLGSDLTRKNHYERLNVRTDATPADIKKYVHRYQNLQYIQLTPSDPSTPSPKHTTPTQTAPTPTPPKPSPSSPNRTPSYPTRPAAPSTTATSST